jgi:hypothetical protein
MFVHSVCSPLSRGLGGVSRTRLFVSGDKVYSKCIDIWCVIVWCIAWHFRWLFSHCAPSDDASENPCILTVAKPFV